MWLGRRDVCATAADATARDLLVQGPQQLQTEAHSLLRSPLPRCGGVAFFHLPKAAGSTIECFLGAQTEFSCCYRGTCGVCKRWDRGKRLAMDGQCEHREQLPRWTHGSTWGEAKALGQFVLPFDLLRVTGRENASSAATLRALRFVAAEHMGPASVTPGMSVTRNSAMVRWTYLRDALFPPLGCSLTLATILRHPVATLLSAYSYVKPKQGLAEWAAEKATSLLGVRADIFADALGREGGKDSHHGAAFDAHVTRLAARWPHATLDPLLSVFDVVGHVERFSESLLLLIDAAGLRHPLACAAPRNTQSQSCGGAQGGRRLSKKRRGGGRARGRPAQAADEADAASAGHACYNGSTSANPAWRTVAAAMPLLVTWYERRLASFDAEVAARGDAFRKRVDALRDLRDRATTLSSGAR